MKKAEYYGIEISELKTGDIITAEEVQNLYEKNVPIGSNHNRKTPLFAFVLTLKKDIEETLFQLGKFARVVQRRGDLHLIQGDSMSEYGEAQFERAIGKSLREAAIFNLVNTDGMTDDQSKRHKRRCFVASQQVESLSDARNKIGLIAGNTKAYSQLRSAEKINWEDK